MPIEAKLKEILQNDDYLNAAIKLLNYLNTLSPKEREEVRIDYGI